MTIKYIGFTVQVHGLNIATEDQMNGLRFAIKQAVESVHPGRDITMFENDVDVDIDEYAGQFDETQQTLS